MCDGKLVSILCLWIFKKIITYKNISMSSKISLLSAT